VSRLRDTSMSRAVPTSSAGADVRNDPIPTLRDHLTDGASPARLPMRRLADAETRSRRARGRANYRDGVKHAAGQAE